MRQFISINFNGETINVRDKHEISLQCNEKSLQIIINML